VGFIKKHRDFMRATPPPKHGDIKTAGARPPVDVGVKEVV
jgi:hypothetical protein